MKVPAARARAEAEPKREQREAKAQNVEKGKFPLS
jgi:hypothetical protein